MEKSVVLRGTIRVRKITHIILARITYLRDERKCHRCGERAQLQHVGYEVINSRKETIREQQQRGLVVHMRLYFCIRCLADFISLQSGIPESGGQVLSRFQTDTSLSLWVISHVKNHHRLYMLYTTLDDIMCLRYSNSVEVSQS